MIHSQVWKECVYKMLSPQVDRMFYILFPRSHNFSTTEFNYFKNLQKARCDARALTQFYANRRVDHSSTELSQF